MDIDSIPMPRMQLLVDVQQSYRQTPNISHAVSSYDHRQFMTSQTSLHMYEFKWLFLLVIELLVFLGNAFLILLIVCNKNLYMNNTTRIVLSLGITDFLLSILVLPFTLYSHVSPHTWDLGFGTCFLWLSSDLQLTTTSILHLCSISYERYLSVASPLKFRKNMKLRIVYLIATSWLLSFFTCALPFMFLSLWDRSFIYQESKVVSPYSTGGKRYVCNYFSRKYLAYGTLITFWAPLIFMIFFGMRTMFLIRKIDRMHMTMSTKGRSRSPIVKLRFGQGASKRGKTDSDQAGPSNEDEKSTSSNGQPAKPAVTKCDASSACRPKKSAKKTKSVSIEEDKNQAAEQAVERDRKFINQLVMANHNANYILPLVDEIEQGSAPRRSFDHRNPRIMIRRRTHCGSGNIYELYYNPSKATTMSKLRNVYSGLPSIPVPTPREDDELAELTTPSPTQLGSPTETTFQLESQANSDNATTSLIERVNSVRRSVETSTRDAQEQTDRIEEAGAQLAPSDTSNHQSSNAAIIAMNDGPNDVGSQNSLSKPSLQTPSPATLSWQRVRVKLAKHRRINTSKSTFSTRKELQAQKTLSIVLIVFLLSYFPLFTFISITAFTTDPGGGGGSGGDSNGLVDSNATSAYLLLNETTKPVYTSADAKAGFIIDLDLVFIFLTWLAYTSGGVNPFLHLLLNNNFKLAFKACFKLDKKKVLVK